MPLNYSSWVVFQGPPGIVKEGVLEVHHEFLRLVIDNETTVVRWRALTSVRAVRRELPNLDELYLTASDGEEHKFELDEDQLSGFIEAIPRSFQLGW